MRQDPDIIMLGEIRDTDTAQMAIQAALTGVLILSTFHTFDIPALVMRLTEIGFSESVIAQAIQGVISTRLVRKICESCKTSYQSTRQSVPGQIYRGAGCSACQQKGYLGRVGIFEVVHFDQDIKICIIEKRPASELVKLLQSKQVKSLKEAAIEKVKEGITTEEELTRIIGYFD